jgi:DnaJ-class molecular chaperone
VDDPYTVLGVKRAASGDEIQRVYRQLAKKYHPDLNPGKAAAEERFKAISAAYELLSDPEKRARYDRGEIDASGAERPPRYSHYRDYAEGQGGAKYHADVDDFGDLFSEIFGGMGGEHGAGGRQQFKRRGSDYRFVLPLDLLDAVNGATRRLQTPEGKTVEVTIPPGIEDGQVLRLRGRGGEGLNGGPPGDALVAIEIMPHPLFRRVGDDLHVDMPITLPQAVLGGKITVPTRQGPVAMTVPEGSDTGRVLRLRGKGVPAHGGRPAGDQYVTLRVALGSAVHDEELKAFLRRRVPGAAAAASAGG